MGAKIKFCMFISSAFWSVVFLYSICVTIGGGLPFNVSRVVVLMFFFSLFFFHLLGFFIKKKKGGWGL